MNNFEWKEIAPMMVGNWQSAILSLTGVDLRNYKPKMHYPCPICGGTDRFRFDDRKPKARSPDGSGGYFCNNCGSGDGMELYTKISGLTFSEAVNTLGGFLNAQPSEIRRKQVEQIANAPRFDYGCEVTHDKCMDFIAKSFIATRSALTVTEGIGPDSLRIIPKQATCDPMAMDGNHRIIAPMRRVGRSGHEKELSNVALIDDCGNPSFLAGIGADMKPSNGITYGAATIIRGDTNIILCVSWVDGWKIHHVTGATVWVTYTPENMDHVAYECGDIVVALAVRLTDESTMIYAEALGSPLLVIAGGGSEPFRVISGMTARGILDKKEPA